MLNLKGGGQDFRLGGHSELWNLTYMRDVVENLFNSTETIKRKTKSVTLRLAVFSSLLKRAKHS